MALTGGSHELGPSAGRLLIRTGRSGLGRRAGHDLTLEATRWSGELTADPADPARSSVTVTVDPGSLQVAEATGGVMPLTDTDRAEIVKNVRGKVLHTDAHPSITFRSTAVEGTPESFTVTGDLTIIGVTRPVTIRGRLAGDRLTGATTVVQSQWGIKPYSALFGQLRVADEVRVEFDLDVS